jgi:hypothetical protein
MLDGRVPGDLKEPRAGEEDHPGIIRPAELPVDGQAQGITVEAAAAAQVAGAQQNPAAQNLHVTMPPSRSVTQEVGRTRRAAGLAQLTSQTMSALMGADLGHLCALQYGDGHRELPCGHWPEAAIAGCSTRRSACGIVHGDKMGAVRRPGNRGRELEVIAVEAGAGRAAFLPVMHTRPSRVAK